MGRFDGVLLASDFDDTLVNRNRQVPERTKRALEEFTREGGRFTIASGRGVEAVERQLGDLPVNAPVVAADGTQIFDFSSGEMRYEARLPDSAAADFAAILQKYATTAVEIYACGKNYCVNPNQVTEEHLKIVGITAEPSSLREIPRPWVYAKFEDDRPVLEQIQAEFLSKFPGYETFFSHRYLLEVAPAGVHKGSGVLELARLLGISGAHVYCAGDNENDLSMLRIARTAFVPAHSTPAALAAADVVVCDCDEGAIADVVEYLKGRYAPAAGPRKPLISGIHHVALKCDGPEEFEKTIGFYRDVLGLELVRSWDGGAMLSTGGGLLEIFSQGQPLPQGTIRHFALATDRVDDCIAAVRAAGYPVYVEPKDIVIASQPPFPARIAFCIGPVGEEIEFFQET